MAIRQVARLETVAAYKTVECLPVISVRHNLCSRRESFVTPKWRHFYKGDWLPQDVGCDQSNRSLGVVQGHLTIGVRHTYCCTLQSRAILQDASGLFTWSSHSRPPGTYLAIYCIEDSARMSLSYRLRSATSFLWLRSSGHPAA